MDQVTFYEVAAGTILVPKLYPTARTNFIRWAIVIPGLKPQIEAAIATCILEHLLEHHFDLFFKRIEKLALADPNFGVTVKLCFKFGEASQATNAKRLDALMQKLR